MREGLHIEGLDGSDDMMGFKRGVWIGVSLLLGLLLAGAALHQLAGVSSLNRHKQSLTPSYASNVQPHVPALHVNSVVQHGTIVEIKGTTDPGAVVMINGEHAAVIFDHNEFRHFVGPLPKGTTIVSITSQNEEGGVSTQKLAVNID